MMEKNDEKKSKLEYSNRKFLLEILLELFY